MFEFKEQSLDSSQDSSKKEQTPFFERIRRSLHRKFGRAALVGLGLLYLTRFEDDQVRRIEPGFSHTKMDKVDFALPDKTKISLKSWDDIELAESNEKFIKPSSEVLRQSFESTDPFFTEVGLYPIKIADHEGFNHWVLKQASDSSILDSVGLKSVEEAGPKQLVEIAVAIAIRNLQYSFDSKEIEKDVKESIDKILMQSLRAECSFYAVAVEAIFKILKENYPEKMRNIYIGSLRTDSEKKKIGHVFNRILAITGEKSAEISFLDATAADVRWGEKFLVNEDFLDILNEWKEGKLIDNHMYLSLKYEYLVSHNYPAEEEWEFLQNDLDSLKNYQDQNVIQFLQRFLRKTNKNEQKELAQKILNQKEG